MPVLELAQLRVKGVPAKHPAVLDNLSLVRGKLHTNSRFYLCIEDPTLIYVLGLWPTLQAHHDFLASPQREHVLGPQEDMLVFCWSVHMELDDLSSLPLDAPVLAIERLALGRDCVDAFNQAAMMQPQLLKGSHTFKVARGWRCDAPTGSHEALIFSGWHNAQAYAGFTENQKSRSDTGHMAMVGEYEKILLHHATDLERINS